MIGFFRRIRKKFADDNQFLKYSRYAIGEILLVVIGILIALQVNTWNEQRINKKIELVYINRLINEVAHDTSYFKLIKNNFASNEFRTRRISKIWKSKIKDFDSILYINDFTKAGDISPWFDEPIGWKQLIQTGDLKLIRDKDLLDILFNYYNSIKKKSDNFNHYPIKMINLARENWVKAFKNEVFEVFGGVEDITKKPDESVYIYIWENRVNYLELYDKIAIISHRNKLGMQELEDLSKEMLEKLKLYKHIIE